MYETVLKSLAIDAEYYKKIFKLVMGVFASLSNHIGENREGKPAYNPKRCVVV